MNIPSISKIMYNVGNKFGDGSKLGNKVKNFNKYIEMDGVNLAFPALATVIVSLVPTSRILDAYDMNDVRDVILRDGVTIATVLLAKDGIKAIISKKKAQKFGLVLVNKGKEGLGKMAKGWEFFKHSDGVKAYSSPELISKYTKIEDYKGGIKGFAKFINENGGDFKKVMTFDKTVKDLTKKASGLDDEAFEALDSKGLLNALEENNNLKELYEFLKSKENPIIQKARLITSGIDVASIALVCAFLGIGLQFLNAAITKHFVKKENQASAPVINSYPKFGIMEKLKSQGVDFIL